MELRFVKMHGARNDFVILDEGERTVKDPAAIARHLCALHEGIGADGLILVRSNPPDGGRVVFLNADGSRAEMCGNGLRCAAHYLVWQHGLPTSLRLETDMGMRRCVIHGGGQGRRADVEVEMGTVQSEGVAGGETWQGHLMHLGTSQVPAFALSLGNPHLVLLRHGLPDEVETLGATLSGHPSFIEGTNVEWVQRIDGDRCEVEVYERGVGRTLACGSGACAAVGALILAGQVEAGRSIEVRMPGGLLQVTIDDRWQAWLRGPSEVVFEGQLQPWW
ncbi:MAG: diaminopimelate epimerase [Pseudomonadota bacterium]